MKRLFVFFAATGAACSLLADGFNTELFDSWRLTVGPQFNFNASGRLGVKSAAIPTPPASSASSRNAAQAAGDKVSIGEGRTDFGNGAFVDTADSAGVEGETWNWYVPAGALKDGTMSIANPYTERSTTYSASGGSDSDDAYSVGASFGLDRLLWNRGKFGVDLGFNFSFFIKDNWFEGSAGGYSRTDKYKEGSYVTDVNLGNADVLSDPWAQNSDGSYGAGSFNGPGPVIDVDEIEISHRWDTERTRTATVSEGPFSIRGDLQAYEFQLALKPYYELTEWFMVRGTVGVGLDYRRLDVRAEGLGKDSERDWDCYMVCGLGGLFHWNDICLGADFLRKIFDDDMSVDTRYVEGSVGNANWTFRMYVGYEF